MRSLQGWVYVTVWFFSLRWEFGPSAAWRSLSHSCGTLVAFAEGEKVENVGNNTVLIQEMISFLLDSSHGFCVVHLVHAVSSFNKPTQAFQDTAPPTFHLQIIWKSIV